MKYGIKSLCSVLCALLIVFAVANTYAADAPTRVNVFSTSTDWEAVTDLRLRQYDIDFRRDEKLIGNTGLEIYILDGFPCYGQPDKTQMWFGPGNATRNNIRIVCLYLPEELKFGWRVATRNALQDATTGILTCPLSRDAIVDMTGCVKGKEWKEF